MRARIFEFVERFQLEGYPFEPVPEAPWIPSLELRFGFRFPELYRVLVTSYIFPEFDAGGLTFYANLNDGAYEDIGVAPFADEYMGPWLVSNGFIQFARPDTGSYYPVCFDMNSNSENPAILWFYHEDILQDRAKVRYRMHSKSLEELIDAKA